MQAYLECSIGIRVIDIEDKDRKVFEEMNEKNEVEIDACGEGWHGEPSGEIIIFQRIQKDDNLNSHFLELEKIKKIKFNLNKYLELLQKYQMEKYIKKVDLYLYCVEY